MLTLLTADQTREADAFTMKYRPISSIDLMESASRAFVRVFTENYPDLETSISVYCGTGNNGGDGLAVARLLKERGYDRISVKIARFNRANTEDFNTNRERLTLTGMPIIDINHTDQFPGEDATVLIDALLGSGLSRPLHGQFRDLVDHLNQLDKIIISIDVPTGFPSEGIIEKESTIINAHLVISFQRPKINFYFPESAPFIERFRFVNIGLDEAFIQGQPGGWKLLEPDDIRSIVKPRKAFSHKGTYGHALIIAGAEETMGAALLCAEACLHSGAGLTTACVPKAGFNALNSSMPEVMAMIRPVSAEGAFPKLEQYQAVAIGPGLGKEEEQSNLLKSILNSHPSSLVLDADALNILALHPELINELPLESILTPHVKEFDRLFGDHQNWWQRIDTARLKAQQHQIIIVLKNQYTFIILPDDRVVINPTGNAAMAVGGMGDVLTGIIVSFLAQGYKPADAALAACYLHGKAGDLLKEKGGMNSIPPRYIIAKLPAVIGIYSAS